MTLIKRLAALLIGNTLASFAISCLIKSGLGCFSVTAANISFATWFGITIGTAGFLVELVILAIATYMKEGIGFAAIFNATYGSLMIDVFNLILPNCVWLVFFLPLIAIGWAMIGKAGYGDTSNNILMNAILKRTNKSIGFIRGIQECIYLIIGILGFTGQVTWFTIVLTFGLGYMLQIIYKLIGYDPTEIKHKFLIRFK